jgi:predicted nuclease of restriction endonuclease-like (RecB) superfamily
LTAPSPAEFDDVLRRIDAARGRAVAAVNKELIDLYWNIGEHISRKIAADGWGQGTVEELAEYIRRRQPNARGFSARNLWRMMQFYETYHDQPKLSALLRELSWSHNLAILSRSKRDEEREFYLRMATRERWLFRELQRQLNGALFELTVWRRQNCQHRWQNCTPKPEPSSKTLICWNSLTCRPSTPRPTCNAAWSRS